MKARFLHIYIKKSPRITDDQVTKTMNAALDWYRCNDTCWFVWSNSSLATWQTRLRVLTHPIGNHFVCEVDATQRIGWMPKDFWTWLGKDRP